jgi:hypothetical protein
VVRGPGIRANTTIANDSVIVANIDIAPTILSVIRESVLLRNMQHQTHQPHDNQTTTIGAAATTTSTTTSSSSNEENILQSLQNAIDNMDGFSFWNFVRNVDSKGGKILRDDADPFVRRTDLLISYHGEGFAPCNLTECPIPDLWWMPDSWNNTYNCVRTIRKESTVNQYTSLRNSTMTMTTTTTPNKNNTIIKAENSIYCKFHDDEQFVEYYDLTTNPYQLHNDVKDLSKGQVEHYEQRLKELLLTTTQTETSSTTSTSSMG